MDEEAEDDIVQDLENCGCCRSFDAAVYIRLLRKELGWYGEQARLALLIHSEGDAGRNALAADGGKRASAAIDAKPPV